MTVVLKITVAGHNMKGKFQDRTAVLQELNLLYRCPRESKPAHQTPEKTHESFLKILFLSIAPVIQLCLHTIE